MESGGINEMAVPTASFCELLGLYRDRDARDAKVRLTHVQSLRHMSSWTPRPSDSQTGAGAGRGATRDARQQPGRPWEAVA